MVHPRQPQNLGNASYRQYQSSWYVSDVFLVPSEPPPITTSRYRAAKRTICDRPRVGEIRLLFPKTCPLTKETPFIRTFPKNIHPCFPYQLRDSALAGDV